MRLYARARGIREREFLNMTHADFWTVIRHMLEPEREEIKRAYMLARLQGFYSLRPHSKTLTNPTQLGKFSWEDGTIGWDEQQVEAVKEINWDDLELKFDK